MADLGVWTVDGDAPQSVPRSAQVELEDHLEGWIAAEPTLLSGDLEIVGRQVKLDSGKLDLLAIDWQDRWVVIELKRARLYRDAITQALDYAASIAQMGSEDLEALLRPGLAALGDADELARAVRQQLDGEEGSREVAVLLAGVGVDAGLERIVAHLGGYGVPISIVTFEAFEVHDGPRLLIREVTEEQTERRPRRPTRSVDEIRELADAVGAASEFDRFLAMAEAADLVVRSFSYAVSVVPRQSRNRRLIYARPRNGGIYIAVHPEVFAEFFPPLTESGITEAFGPPGVSGHFTGPSLDARLDQIEAFLKTLPSQDADDSE
ncbi:MAG: DUF91 domain-containing protein [Chloroflexi bacterium]|nr:DUF91 domain-containing protein [Chloroflexota bacterium]